MEASVEALAEVISMEAVMNFPSVKAFVKVTSTEALVEVTSMEPFLDVTFVEAFVKVTSVKAFVKRLWKLLQWKLSRKPSWELLMKLSPDLLKVFLSDLPWKLPITPMKPKTF